MNPILPIAALGLLYLAKSRADSRELVKGRAYVATFKLPTNAAGITPEQLASVLPDGASVQPDGLNIIVTFTAPSNATIGDIPTPLGTIKLVGLRKMADVVGGLPPPSPYVFSWWERKPGIGFVWSGWKGPKVLPWRDMNTAMARLSPGQQFPRVLRWTGSKWEEPV